MKQIAVIVVTFNRKELLKKCLNALFSQEYKPAAIYIIDNNSSDGTHQTLQKEGFLKNETIQIHYINTGKNLGGAGGFSLGVKTAHETCLYDAYVLMDDDGCPDKNEIKNLVPHLGKYDYINALVVDIDDETKLSFSWNKETGRDRAKASLLQNEDGVVLNYASPFNGTMVSKRLVDKIGYPKAEMFIHGDETEYLNRSKKNGFIPISVINAIHRHPGNNAVTLYCDIMGLKIPYVLKNNPLLVYCRHRNQIYNISGLKNIVKIILTDIVCLYYYNKDSKSLAKALLSGVWAGIRGDFTGHLKYLNDN